MAISKELLDILVCPVCRIPVKLTPDGAGLKCEQCRRVYPIQDDIPTWFCGSTLDAVGFSIAFFLLWRVGVGKPPASAGCRRGSPFRGQHVAKALLRQLRLNLSALRVAACVLKYRGTNLVFSLSSRGKDSPPRAVFALNVRFDPAPL